MRFVYVLVALPFLSVPALANPACDGALIVSTYSENSSFSSDWRLAKFIDEGTWNTLRKGASANGSIQGVPVGGSYQEYKKNITKKSQGSSESLSINQARSVFWTGLDPNAPSVYRDCLDSQSKQLGLHASVVALTDSQVIVLASYRVPGSDKATVTWSPAEIDGVPLNKEIIQGGDAYVNFPRPKTTLMLTGSFGGLTTKVIFIEPQPKPLPPEIPNCVKQKPEGTCVRCEFSISESSSPHPTKKFADKTCTNMPKGEKVKFEVSNFSTVYQGPKNVNCHMGVNLIGADGTTANSIVSEATVCDVKNRSGASAFIMPEVEGFATVSLMMPTCDGHVPQGGSCDVAGRISVFTVDGQ